MKCPKSADAHWVLSSVAPYLNESLSVISDNSVKRGSKRSHRARNESVTSKFTERFLTADPTTTGVTGNTKKHLKEYFKKLILKN